MESTVETADELIPEIRSLMKKHGPVKAIHVVSGVFVKIDRRSPKKPKQLQNQVSAIQQNPQQ